jgi:hypothetical protein
MSPLAGSYSNGLLDALLLLAGSIYVLRPLAQAALAQITPRAQRPALT